MRQQRKHPPTKRLALAVALMALPALACGPTIFADTTALPIVGTPPAPPPPPEPEPEPEPEPPKRVEVTAAAIVIHDKILFETAKAKIRAESFDLVNEIAQVLEDNPRIKKISIEGHTDSQGKTRYNQKLSNRRATAVMAHLVEHGVDEARLTAIGYGESKPIGDNETSEGRETNRRVEFIIVEQDELKETVEIDPETGEKKVVETAAPSPSASPTVTSGAEVAAPPKKSKGGPPARAKSTGGAK